MIPTRSHSCSTSSMSWLDSTIVRGPPPSSRISARMSACPPGSSPLDGSSRISTRGSFKMAAATPSRCRIP